jgi:UDP-N-acetylmuramate dehydrogenase
MLNPHYIPACLADYTTTHIGPDIEYFFTPSDIDEMLDVIQFIKNNNLPWYILGGGSNTIFNEEMDGYRAVLSLIGYKGIELLSQTSLVVKAGTTLQDLVDYSISHKLDGLVGLNRIPGTVGGAVVGNAGAYGTEICQSIVEVHCLKWDTLELITLSNTECKFLYRDSYFKHDTRLLVLDIVFSLQESQNVEQLNNRYTEIATIRDKVYPIGFRSPGSTFKNLLLSDLKPQELANIPEEYIMKEVGKVPIAKLLETCGAKGLQFQGARMRPSHANIMEIVSDTPYSSVVELVNTLKDRVYKGIQYKNRTRNKTD